MQFGVWYDNTLLDFKGINNQKAVSNWIYYLNPEANVVDWGGYDPTGKDNLVKDQDVPFVLQFIAKKPKAQWGTSPLWVTRKAAGDENSNDYGITPTDGIIKVFRISGGSVNVENGQMMIYPNPTSDYVIITFKIEKDVNANLGIYDIQGKKCLDVLESKNMPDGKYTYTVDLGNLKPGIYTAVLTSDNSGGKYTASKIIKSN
jgi:hypothetical protein